jgi:hypothetical protein
VKSIRILGLAAFTVLALMALTGLASASSGAITAEKYPATLTGEQGSYSSNKTSISTRLGAPSCTAPTITAEVKHATGEATASAADSTCSTGSMKMNGCQFILHPEVGKGSFDIGGAGCGSIKISMFGGCVVSIPAQTGLAATFSNTGAGSEAKFEVKAEASGLKYQLTSGKACEEGSYSDGSWNGSWLVKGKNEGKATGVSVAPFPGFSVQNEMFHSELYPVVVGGSQTTGVIGGKTLKMIEFSTQAGSISCSSAVFSAGTLEQDSTELWLSPSFSSCTMAGLKATAVTTECHNVLSIASGPPYAGVQWFTCSGGNAFEFTNYVGCKVTLLEQIASGSGGVGTGMEYVNVGSGSSSEVEAKANLIGIDYEIAGGEAKCGEGVTNGLHTDGTWKGALKVKGEKLL